MAPGSDRRRIRRDRDREGYANRGTVLRGNGTALLSSILCSSTQQGMTYYEITAVTPEEGEVCYHTPEQSLARMIHSELLGRQLDKDGTHSVTVRLV